MDPKGPQEPSHYNRVGAASVAKYVAFYDRVRWFNAHYETERRPVQLAGTDPLWLCGAFFDAPTPYHRTLLKQDVWVIGWHDHGHDYLHDCWRWGSVEIRPVSLYERLLYATLHELGEQFLLPYPGREGWWYRPFHPHSSNLIDMPAVPDKPRLPSDFNAVSPASVARYEQYYESLRQVYRDCYGN